MTPPIREMCEWTAKVFNAFGAKMGASGPPITGEEIWHGSSTGEVWPVYGAYEAAQFLAPSLGIPPLSEPAPAPPETPSP
jgi:hypothetical protein